MEQCAPKSLSELLALSSSEIKRCDIARANLLCAEGMPGSEGINISKCLATLDGWTQRIRKYVRDCGPDYQHASADYYHHKGFFNFLCMVTVLKHPNGLGVSYQPNAVGNFNFRDSRDDLLTGLLTRKLGTCASLPVLFVAIGRRLGWPMHLAVAKQHVLCQWLNEDRSHRNLEGSCPGGGNTFDDDHYHNWPRRLSDQELASGRYLRPLSAAESLSLFLETRGHCLVDNGRFAEAREAYEVAFQLAPQWSLRNDHLACLQSFELRKLGVEVEGPWPMGRQVRRVSV
jgi:hypothetical protein